MAFRAPRRRRLGIRWSDHGHGVITISSLAATWHVAPSRTKGELEAQASGRVHPVSRPRCRGVELVVVRRRLSPPARQPASPPAGLQGLPVVTDLGVIMACHSSTAVSESESLACSLPSGSAAAGCRPTVALAAGHPPLGEPEPAPLARCGYHPSHDSVPVTEVTVVTVY